MNKLIISLLFFSLSSMLSAYPALSELTAPLDEEALADIDYENDCHRSSKDDGKGLIWLPEHPLSERIMSLYNELEPGLTVEIVSVLPMEGPLPDDMVIQTANKFLSISEQEGIMYYSSSRKKEMELIERSFAVPEVGKRKAIDDPRFDSIPFKQDTYVYQKDSSFGGNYFLYHSEISEDALFLTTTNKTNLTVMGFFTVAEPDENIMVYLVVPCEEAIYIYTAVFVNDPPRQEKMFGISVNIEGFMLKRVRKIIEWFSVSFNPH